MLLIAGEPITVVSRTADGTTVAHPSGAPAIAAWVAARLGTPTAFVGAVGDDDAGRVLRETLAAAGVDVSGVVTRPAPTARADVRYLADGDREFVFDVERSAAPTLTDDDLGARPEQARWVHASGSALLFGDPLAGAVEEAVHRGRAAGATTSLDPNLRDELTDPALRRRLAALCTRVDVLFPSDGELEQLGLDEGRLVAAGVVVCHSSAAAGLRLRVRDVDLSVPAVAAAGEVVDPDGAGDTLAGAAIAAVLAGRSWPDAVRIAARVVARAIAVPGPMTVDLTSDDLTPADLAPTDVDRQAGQ